MSDSAPADPILDLLGKMESQISRIETRPEKRASASTPTADASDLGSLRDELAESEKRGAQQLLLFTEALTRLRTQIPELVEEAIASRFLDVEERFYGQVREIQSRAMDTFLQTSQARVGTRMAALESTLAEQSAALAEMRENVAKNDRNIDRLLQGLDRLTAELMRLSTLAGAPLVNRRVAQLTPAQASLFSPAAPVEPRPVFSEPPAGGRRAALADFVESTPDAARYKKISQPSALFIPALVVVLLLGVGFVIWQIASGGGLHLPRKSTPLVAALSATETQLKTAEEFAAGKDYAKAESIYRTILRGEPDNRLAIKELASVLFKQQRYEEAASVLKTLPAGN